METREFLVNHLRALHPHDFFLIISCSDYDSLSCFDPMIRASPHSQADDR